MLIGTRVSARPCTIVTFGLGFPARILLRACTLSKRWRTNGPGFKPMNFLTMSFIVVNGETRINWPGRIFGCELQRCGRAEGPPENADRLWTKGPLGLG